MRTIIIAQNEFGLITKEDPNFDTICTYNLRSCVALLVTMHSGKQYLGHIDIATSQASIERLLINPLKNSSDLKSVKLIANFSFYEDSSISKDIKALRMDNLLNLMKVLSGHKLNYQIIRNPSDAIIVTKDDQLISAESRRETSEYVILKKSDGEEISLAHESVINAIANLNSISVIYSRNQGFLDLHIRFQDQELTKANPEIVRNGKVLIQDSKDSGFTEKEQISEALWDSFKHDFGGNLYLIANSILTIIDFEERSQSVLEMIKHSQPSASGGFVEMVEGQQKVSNTPNR